MGEGDRDTIAATQLLGIDRASAASDLRRLIRRELPPAGTRQENFTPTEVLLCLAAMYVVDFTGYGSQTAHTAPSPVPELAALARRPTSSILAKMANLAGARSHGGLGEVKAASKWLADDGEALLRSYRIVLATARELDIDEATLPDFLPVRPVVIGGRLPGVTS